MTDPNPNIDRVGNDVDFTFYASDNARWRFVRLGRWYEMVQQRIDHSPAAYIRGVSDAQGVLKVYWAFSATPLRAAGAVVEAWNELGETSVDFNVASYKGLEVGAGDKPVNIVVAVDPPTNEHGRGSHDLP